MEAIAPCLWDGAIIYVSAWHMNEFFTHFYPRIPEDGRQIVLVTGESDQTVPFPEHMQYILDEGVEEEGRGDGGGGGGGRGGRSKIRHWFGQNGRPVPKGARFTSIPIGLNCFEQASYLAEAEAVVSEVRGRSSLEEQERLAHPETGDGEEVQGSESGKKKKSGEGVPSEQQEKWLKHLTSEHAHRHLDWDWQRRVWRVEESGGKAENTSVDRWSVIDPWIRFPPPLVDLDAEKVEGSEKHDPEGKEEGTEEQGHSHGEEGDAWLVLNFDVTTDGTGSRQQLWSLACREEVFDAAANRTVVKHPGWSFAHCQSKERGVQQYLSKMTSLYLHHLGFPYWASPRGNGIDCHRTWEALYLGRVPILRGQDPEDPDYVFEDGAMDPQLVRNLPILWVKEWSEVTLERLRAHWAEVWRRRRAGVYQFEKLEEVYWAKKILRRSAYWSKELDQLHSIRDVLTMVERNRPKRCWGPR